MALKGFSWVRALDQAPFRGRPGNPILDERLILTLKYIGW